MTLLGGEAPFDATGVSVFAPRVVVGMFFVGVHHFPLLVSAFLLRGVEWLGGNCF
jgi:hypothetical protein